MKKGFTLAEVFMPKRTSGIENKVLYSRESEGQAPSKTNKKLAAFTLAEVLITLAIIGVVAALTIPVVVQNYQKQQFYTRFIKVFNTISNALALAQAEHGNAGTWGTDFENSSEQNNEIYEKNLLSYLRIERICSSASDCGIPNNLSVKALNHSMGVDYASNIFNFNNTYYIKPVILTDGSLIQFALADSARELGEVYIDTNGIKGPNIVGRDIFNIPANNKNGVIVLGDESLYTDEEIEEGCSTAQESFGITCSMKLLRDGKMDY